MTLLRISCLLLIILAIVGCFPKKNTAPTDKLNVVCTTGMIADLAKVIGGNRVIVTGLMGPGVDPHMYRSSEGDVRRLNKADIVFYNGLDLEAKMEEFLVKLAEKKAVHALAETIAKQRLIPVSSEGNVYDPHVWFDASLFAIVAENMTRFFEKEDPKYAAEYRARLSAFINKNQALDRYVRERSAELAKSERVLITAHDAFQYFGHAYGFEVLGLQGVSTQSKAGIADVQTLANTIVSRKIKAIFVESSVPKRHIEAVQAAVRSRGWNVNIGGALYSDALGPANSTAGTYLGMVRHNIDTIVTALLGTPVQKKEG